MKFLIFLLCSASLFGQSFPGAVYTPLVAHDNVQTTLSSAMLAGDAVAIVASSTGWTVNTVAYICDATTGTGATLKCTAFEAMLVTNVATNVLTVTRSYGGTTATAHASGKVIANNIVAVYNKSITDEVVAIETALGPSLNKVATLAGTSAITGTWNARGAAATSPVQTGLNAAKPGTCTAGQEYFSTDVTAGQNIFLCTAANTWTQTTTLPSATAQLQYLRIKPNTGNLTTQEFAALPRLTSTDYAFPAQSPGGSLIAGSNTITLVPCPVGVNGTDASHYLYVSAGVGTAEATLITGGTCTSGAASGTVTITAGGTHSGAWTIQSATAGIKEALQAGSASAARVIIPGGAYTLYSVVDIPATMSLRGSGMQSTYLNMATGFVTRAMQAIAPTGGHGVDIGDFTISYTTNGTSQEGLYVQEISDGVVSNLGIIHSYDGITGYGVGRVHFVGVNLFPLRNGYNFSSDSLSVIQNVSVPTILGGFVTMASKAAGTVIALGPTIAGMNVIGLESVLGSLGISAIAASGAINEVNILDSIIDSTGSLTIDVNLTGTATASRWTISNNKMSAASSGGTGGVFVSAATAGNITGFILTNNTILCNDAAANGISLQGISGGIIAGNLVSNSVAGGNGLLLDGFANDDLNIEGNNLGLGSLYTLTNRMNYGIFINAQAHTRISVLGNRLTGSTLAFSNASTVAGGVVAVGNIGVPDTVIVETGANNAIAGALVGVPLVAGTKVTILLAHTLQAGANTFNFNGGGALAIKSARNPANNIATAWAVGGTITLYEDGTQWLDLSQ